MAKLGTRSYKMPEAKPPEIDGLEKTLISKMSSIMHDAWQARRELHGDAKDELPILTPKVCNPTDDPESSVSAWLVGYNSLAGNPYLITMKVEEGHTSGDHYEDSGSPQTLLEANARRQTVEYPCGPYSYAGQLALLGDAIETLDQIG